MTSDLEINTKYVFCLVMEEKGDGAHLSMNILLSQLLLLA